MRLPNAKSMLRAFLYSTIKQDWGPFIETLKNQDAEESENENDDSSL